MSARVMNWMSRHKLVKKNLTPPPGNSSGNLEQQIASTSQLIGSLLAEDMNSEQAANIARGWASSQASG
ncbi:hypothetical protein DMI62_19620 [Escherichia coli]|nr:hypothetical protein [Escherichia coli]